MKEISKIQSEIKAIKKYREEANELIKRINNSVSEINSSSEMKIKVIKEKIAADVTELKTYMSEDIYTTKSISLYNYVEKEKSANGDYYYPLANFIIRFNCKCYSIDHEAIQSEYGIAIIENCHSYAPIYADGHWADEFPDIASVRNWGKQRNVIDLIEILCRNWNKIIEGAYTEIKLAYQKDTENKLHSTLKTEEDALIRYNALCTESMTESTSV